MSDLRLPLAPYAWREVILFSVAPLLISLGLVVGWATGGPGWLGVVGAVGAVASAGVAAFFRDPTRWPPQGEEKVLAPADGKIVGVEEIDRDDYLGEKGVEIDIFLSIFNAHVNRSPVNGVVEEITYRKGSFLSALRPSAARVNEQNSIRIQGEGYRVIVRQIAGAVARRIVCACKKGDSLERGERIGMIKFGSRTQVLLPTSVFQPAVKPGDRVKAGISVIGTIRREEPS